MEPRLLEFLRFASEELGIWVLIFTNATVLANENATWATPRSGTRPCVC